MHSERAPKAVMTEIFGEPQLKVREVFGPGLEIWGFELTLHYLTFASGQMAFDVIMLHAVIGSDGYKTEITILERILRKEHNAIVQSWIRNKMEEFALPVPNPSMGTEMLDRWCLPREEPNVKARCVCSCTRHPLFSQLMDWRYMVGGLETNGMSRERPELWAFTATGPANFIARNGEGKFDSRLATERETELSVVCYVDATGRVETAAIHVWPFIPTDVNLWLGARHKLAFACEMVVGRRWLC